MRYVCLKTGLTPRRIRWYERRGLLGLVERSAGDQRRYSNDQIERILEIKRLQSLGLTLRDIEALLDESLPAEALVQMSQHYLTRAWQLVDCHDEICALLRARQMAVEDGIGAA